MVDPQGNYFEGRRLIYMGSHVGGANSRKIGIIVLGDFHPQWWDFDDEVSEKQKSATISLIPGAEGTLSKSRHTGWPPGFQAL